MTLDDPYRAPGVDSDDRDVGEPLFSPLAVAWHAALFTPLVGGAMAAMNYLRVGNKTRAWQTLALAVGACVVITLLAMFAPEPVARGSLGGTVALAIGWKREQEQLVLPHYGKGRQKASPWIATAAGVVLAAAGIGLLVLGGD